MSIDVSLEIGHEKLNFNTGYLAKQADGAVLLSYGDTVVFASAVMSENLRDGQDFFPLTVDYREKSYAAGNIPGGFIKRESRPSDRETLTCRLTDRPLRPLFPKDFIHEVQVIIYVLSSDGENQPDVLAINAASAALMISGMPFHGPVGAVRVGRINGEFVVNPTFSQEEESDIDLMVAGTKNAVTMIEGSSKNISEEDVLGAVEFAHENIKKICDTQNELVKLVDVSEKEYISSTPDQELTGELREKYYADLEGLAKFTEKKDREKGFNNVVKKAKEELAEKYSDTIGQVHSILDSFDGEIVRRRILEDGARADGRSLKDVRPIDGMVGFLPRVHGSAVFTRGQTQSLGITTLGTMSDAQRLDNLEGHKLKHFMLHYQFPPFSVGETGRTGGVGRREIGHGMLAERALTYIIPDVEDFPYTIRQISEVMESNGSSSMATVCSGSMALFNAGVPVKAPVAGIAMGLVMEGDKYAILTDIQGLEDHLGDMDFKVAGTSEGITAFQLDIKIEGITLEIMKLALQQAKEGRLHILGEMAKVISEPETKLSEYAAKIEVIQINPDKIGEVIGPGGKHIKKIIEESGADINIVDSGDVTISAIAQSAIDKAKNYILGMVKEVEPGKVYDGVVKRVVDFGAFVEVLPRKEGLLHISNISKDRIKTVSDVLKLGDKVKVRVIKVDKQGRIDLSSKEFFEQK